MPYLVHTTFAFGISGIGLVGGLSGDGGAGIGVAGADEGLSLIHI